MLRTARGERGYRPTPHFLDRQVERVNVGETSVFPRVYDKIRMHAGAGARCLTLGCEWRTVETERIGDGGMSHTTSVHVHGASER